MSQDIRPFRKFSTCDKCGSESIKYSYFPRAENAWGTEFLGLKCERCGFEWQMKCAESAPSSDQEENAA